VSYAVRILPAAKADRRAIFRYLDERSPQGAKSWEAAYEQVLTRLENDPLFCGYAPENEYFDIELRQILFSTRSGLTYRIVFRVDSDVDSDVVTIYRLRGPGQLPLSSVDMPRR